MMRCAGLASVILFPSPSVNSIGVGLGSTVGAAVGAAVGSYVGWAGGALVGAAVGVAAGAQALNSIASARHNDTICERNLRNIEMSLLIDLHVKKRKPLVLRQGASKVLVDVSCQCFHPLSARFVVNAAEAGDLAC